MGDCDGHLSHIERAGEITALQLRAKTGASWVMPRSAGF
jgi:hypothetical protein